MNRLHRLSDRLLALAVPELHAAAGPCDPRRVKECKCSGILRTCRWCSLLPDCRVVSCGAWFQQGTC